MIWKLPSHLEPFREFINIYTWVSIEEAINNEELGQNKKKMRRSILDQVAVLINLYDAEKLK